MLWCYLWVPNHIKGQLDASLWSVSHEPSCLTHTWMLLVPFPLNWHLMAIIHRISMSLSFVLWGLLCGWHHYIFIKPVELECCAIPKHSSVLSQYNPFSDRSITPKIPRTADSRWLVRVNQSSWRICLIWCNTYLWLRFKLFPKFPC